jgi:hypothetical protein
VCDGAAGVLYGWCIGGATVSYDVYIGRESFNYTSNVAQLFYDHIPATDESRGGLHQLHGKTGKQAGEILSDAFDRIYQTRAKNWSENQIGDPKFCAIYDADNGWGSTVGGLLFLSRIMAACFRNPRNKVGVSA